MSDAEGYGPRRDPEHQVAERMAEVLQEQLPGFKVHADPIGGTIGVAGYVRFGARAGYDPLELTRVPIPGRNDMAEHVLDGLIHATREEGIKLLGLQSVIDERIADAVREAESRARADGLRAGQIIGERDAIAALEKRAAEDDHAARMWRIATGR